MIYRQAMKFGERPYRYVAPHLQDARNQLNIDTVIESHGLQDELEQAQEVNKQMRQRMKDESRN